MSQDVPDSTQEPHDIIWAFRNLTLSEQDRVIADLQEELSGAKANPKPIQASVPKGTPEQYQQVIDDLHRLQWYSIERGMRQILRNILPDIVSDIVRKELKFLLGSNR